MAKNINVILTLQDRFTKKMSEASYETLKFKRNLALAQTVSDKFAGVMHTMETAAVVGITAAGTTVAAAGKSFLDEYKKTSDALNNVAGVKGISAASNEMEQLTKKVKEASKAVKGTTYEDAANSLYYISQAGLSTEQALNTLEPVLKAVRIQGGDVKVTADSVTDSMTTLGLASTKTADYVDKCAAVQSAANTDMLMLQEALMGCGAAMTKLGLDSGATEEDLERTVDDTMALVGILSSGGTKGSEAGTAINSIYRRLVKDSAEAQDGLDELGMSVYDAEGRLKAVPELFGEMGDKLKELNQQERNSILSKIGGMYSSDLSLIINGITVEDETGSTMYEQIKTALANYEGAADRYIGAISSDYGGAVETLDGVWSNFKSDAGEIIAPYAIEFIEYISEKLPTIQEWLENNLPTALDKGKEIVIEIKDTLAEFKPIMEWIADHWQQIAIAAGGIYAGMGAFRIGTGVLEAYDTLSKFNRGLGKQREAKAAIWENANGLDLFSLIGGDELTGKGNPRKKKNAVKGNDGKWYRKVSAENFESGSVNESANIFGSARGDTRQRKDYINSAVDSFPFQVDFGNVIDLASDIDENGNIILKQSALGLDDLTPVFKDGVKSGIEEAVDATAKSKNKKSMIGILGGAADTGFSLTGLSGMAGASTAGAVTGGGATVGSAGGVAGGVIGSGGALGTIGSAAAAIAPFAALAAIIAGAYSQSENFRKSIKNFADNVSSSVKPALDNIKDGFSKGWKAAQPLVDWLKDGLKQVGDFLAPIVNFMGPIVSGFADIVGMGLGALFETVGKALGAIGTAFEKISDFFDPFTSKIKAAWEWLSDLSEEFSEFIGLVTKDEETKPSEYKTLAYEGDPSMINGTIAEQNNPGGGVTSEQEGGEGDGSGLEPYLKSDGTWGYRPSFNTSTIDETTGALTEGMQEREEKFKTEGKALGTNYWKGGIVNVNERGGEIMDLPRGTRIYPADKSKKMMSEKGGPVVIVNVENFYGDDERYIERVGDKIAHKLAMNM